MEANTHSPPGGYFGNLPEVLSENSSGVSSENLPQVLSENPEEISFGNLPGLLYRSSNSPEVMFGILPGVSSGVHNTNLPIVFSTRELPVVSSMNHLGVSQGREC